MDRVNIIAVLVCLFSSLAVGAARNLGKNSGHQHSSVSKDVGSPRSYVHMNVNETDPKYNETKAIMDLCNATFPTPMDHFIQLNETGEFPLTATRDSKCYLKCLFTRFELIDENGNIKTTITEKLFADKQEDAHIIPVFSKCFDEKDKTEDACESTYNKISCLMKGALDYYGDGKNRKGKGDKM